MKTKWNDVFHLIALAMTVTVAWVLAFRLFPDALPVYKVLIGLFLGVVGMVCYLICGLIVKIAFRNGADWISVTIYGILLIASLFGVK